MSNDASLSRMSALKIALLAQQTRAQTEHILRADPIAIVGLSCRVPGGKSPEEFWTLLQNGEDSIREVPADRWDAAAWYDADLSAAAKSSTRFGGFLGAIDGFDAEYFGILPREADRMDPQQRLFLEVALEACQDAGLTRESMAGSRTGVFIASYHNDYAAMQYQDVEDIDARTLTGTLHSVLANRLSFLLDLRGPSISIDTACSSSLVAIHLACQSLRFGESDVAVAGGVSLMIAPELMVSMSKVGFMSPDGRCKTFDELADGFGRGEGCGVIVLKRLSDAVADGDRVLAVVRGSAVNQDGHSTLLAAPRGPAQEALIREALASAQLEPERIGYVEAHGTGTALGDPIEVDAIAAVIGRDSTAAPCLLGSAKANIGHLEAAAGVTGLIKSVLALQHELVPPQANFTQLSKHISLAGTRLRIPTAAVAWPKGTTPRCAAISSFGVGGTNAHVIIEEAPQLPSLDDEMLRSELQVLPLSARTRGALRDSVELWIPFLETTNELVGDICYTAAQRRSRDEQRVVVCGTTNKELAARLKDFLNDATSPALAAGQRSPLVAPRLGFVFGGQGPQWAGMGQQLLKSEPVFRDMIEACDAALLPHSGWSLTDELAKADETSRLDQTEVAQPALFAIQIALAALWRSWGIVPGAIVGHSVGEIAALYVAGALDLDTAVRVVWHRGRIMQQATSGGSMASVGLPEADAAKLVHPYGHRLTIGAVNGPRSVVLSGETQALDEVLDALTARGVAYRRLPVQYAFHSAQMAPFERMLTQELSGVRAASPAIDVYSTVTGARMSGPFDASYFGRNVRSTVRFASAIDAMLNDGCDVFLEIGPHPVLSGPIAEVLADRGDSAVLVTSLRRGKPESETMHYGAAALHAAGIDLDWEILQSQTGSVVSLPAYPWQRKRHWIRVVDPSSDRRSSSDRSNAGHPLLRAATSLAVRGLAVHEGDDAFAGDWLSDHVIFGRPLLPATAIFELLVTAAQRQFGTTVIDVAEFVMHRPVELPARWQVVVEPRSATVADIAIFERADSAEQPFKEIARGTASARNTAEPLTAARIGALETKPSIDATLLYERFAVAGADFGPAFRCLHDIRVQELSATARVELPDFLDDGSYRVHPALLDAALQLCSAAAGLASEAQPLGVFLPVGADRIVWHGQATPSMRAHATIATKTASTLSADVTLTDSAGAPVVSIVGMRFVHSDASKFASVANTSARPAYEVRWEAIGSSVASAATPDAFDGSWIVFTDGTGTGAALVGELRERGGNVVTVSHADNYSLQADRQFTIDPSQPSHFVDLLRDVRSHEGPSGQVRGVLHLWNLDVAVANETSLVRASADDEVGVASVLHLVQALVSEPQQVAVPLMIVTRGAHLVSGSEAANTLHPAAAAAWGLAGVITLEHPELRVHQVDLDPAAAFDDATALIDEITRIRGGVPVSTRVAVRDGELRVAHLRNLRAPSNAPSNAPSEQERLIVAGTGSLDGLVRRPLQHRTVAANELRIRVRASGLNFRDVLLTLGMYPGSGVALGAECCGDVVEIGNAVQQFSVGDRVFGYAQATLATEVVVPAAFCALVTPDVSDAEAAGLAVAYMTAMYGLQTLAGLKRGDRVLIHAAAGGVGLAAVHLARQVGAEVFATAGSPEKRAMLLQLGVRHVMDSRTLDFAEEVRVATSGAGVDVILNSLAGEFISRSLSVLAQNGRFLELGKRDVWSSEDMAHVRPDAQYFLYDLGAEAEADHALLPPMLAQLGTMLATGALPTLPVTEFEFGRAADAMRFMAQARHIGKIIIRMPAANTLPAQTRMSPEHSYIVTGGMGALGLETARWLVARGARHVVLTARRAPSERATEVARELEAIGATVEFAAIDAADRDAMHALFERCDQQGRSIRGVVHAAGALRNGVITSQRWAEARNVLQGKWHGALVLHELTRKRQLDFFVLYSAAGALLGASGQGLYAAANARLDALAEARVRDGLPALSVAWGAWDVGMAADTASARQDIWQERGLAPISADVAFTQLDALLAAGHAAAAVLPIDWTRFLAQLPVDADRSMFSEVARSAPQKARRKAAAAPPTLVAERLRALPMGARKRAIYEFLTQQVLQVLGLEANTSIDPRAALKDIGLDSLMSVEMRNALNRMSPCPLPATLLFDYPTLDALASHIGTVWQLDGVAAVSRASFDPQSQDAAPMTPSAAATAIASMSDEEAELMLLAELDRGISGNVR